MSWQTFADITQDDLDYRYHSNLLRMSALQFRGFLKTGGGPPTVNMMLSFSWLDCTIPHDRVYAVRHLLKSGAIMALVPDYSLPIQQLFSTTTAILLQVHPKDKSDRPSIIARASIGESEHPSALLAIARLSKSSQDATVRAAWPTWVPDYHDMRSEMERISLQYDENQYHPNFNANNSRMHVRSSIEAWRTIQIKGRPFGTIGTILQTSVLPRMPSHLTKDMSCIFKYGLELLRWYEGCREFVHNTTGSAPRPNFEGLFNCGRWGTYFKRADNGNRSEESQNAYLPSWSGPIEDGWSKTLPLPLEAFDLEGASVLKERFAHNGIVIPSALISPPSGKRGERTELEWPSIVLIPWSLFNNIPTTDVQCHKVRKKEELPVDFFDAIIDLQSALGPIWGWGSEPRMEERRVLCSFPTARGIRFGWVPPDSRSDDELCYFAGAPFPFVVRRVDGSDARVLIGDAWVHDVLEWDARVPDPVRQDMMASLWPHPTNLSRPLLINWMERQVARDPWSVDRVLKMVEQWEEANMGWITLQ
jgi:hypothetical protein